jgi:hypothetical protein
MVCDLARTMGAQSHRRTDVQHGDQEVDRVRSEKTEAGRHLLGGGGRCDQGQDRVNMGAGRCDQGQDRVNMGAGRYDQGQDRVNMGAGRLVRRDVLP